jgi:16S rRNA (cytidine1402-2'-O)-methyltransferase
MNPAVSLGLALSGRMTAPRAAFYIVAQIIGAITGTAMAKAISPLAFDLGKGGMNALQILNVGDDAVAHTAGQAIFAAPGPSAMLAALTVSGLPSDRFMFAGFPPPAAGARKTWIAELAGVKATLILYESPKRVSRLLTELRDALGEGRQAAVCRELTKRFEEVARGTLGELSIAFADRPLRGEVVVVIDRPSGVVADPQAVEAALRLALQTGRLRDVSGQVAAAFGLSRRDVYQMGLALDDDD